MEDVIANCYEHFHKLFKKHGFPVGTRYNIYMIYTLCFEALHLKDNTVERYIDLTCGDHILRTHSYKKIAKMEMCHETDNIARGFIARDFVMSQNIYN